MGPGTLLAPELAVVLETDPAEARRLARLHTGGFYLTAPNYVENLRWLGWSDDDLAGAGSDALVDAIVAWGDEAAIARRIRDHLDAGADHVCIQPVTEIRPLVDGPDTAAIGVLRRLAPALSRAVDSGVDRLLDLPIVYDLLGDRGEPRNRGDHA